MPEQIELDAIAATEKLLRDAAEAGATDLHLDPHDGRLEASIRRDGVLELLETYAADVGASLVARFKAMAELLAFRHDVPQEGTVSAERSPVAGELRVGSFPTVYGERVVVRLESPDGGPRPPQTLGLPQDVVDSLRAALAKSEGVLLVSGPSGSGKTTTIYSMLAELAIRPPRRSILTVEDPIERKVAGLVQCEVRPAVGLTYARAVRALLRQDPDVIHVGELRDPETAAIAMEAGLTGHLVTATVHGADGPQVLAGLMEMGIPPHTIASALHGVLALRLVRKHCCVDGCERCRGTGYAGRRPIAAWTPLGRHLRRAVLARADRESLAEAARADGSLSLREAAEHVLEQGFTTPEEMDRVLLTY